MAESSGERQNSNLRATKVTLFPGTEHEVVVDAAAHDVQAMGSPKYTPTVLTNLGVDDARALSAKAQGQEEFVPIWKRVSDKLKAGRKVSRVADGSVVQPSAPVAAAPAKPLPGTAAELAAQLEPFEGDPQMQDLITKKWQKRRDDILAAQEKAAAKMLGTAAPVAVEA